MTHYVAVDIGCIECSEPSAVLGIFTDESVAESVCAKEEEWQKSNWHGQHSFAVFAVDEIDKPQARAEEGSG